MHRLKYFSILSIPITVYIAFTSEGILTFLPIIYVFGFVPLVELLIKPNSENLSEAEESFRKNDPFYDAMLYATVPIQYSFLVFFLFSIRDFQALATSDLVGRIMAMGLMCGAFGINVAHELGHRKKKYEQFLAKSLLLSSLYMHFFIEHNRGHHKNIATREDPASARFNEPVYIFWLRSVWGSYWSAWKLEVIRLKHKNLFPFTPKNEMLIYQILQIGLVVGIALFFSSMVALYFVFAAVMGFLLLETVNYIEHYGLNRNKKENGKYERVMPHHSWNSDHIVGRVLLFELSRHSDHHFIATRKYQVLRHHEDSPQMPTGYPGMMVLSLFPPLWFWVMHRQSTLKNKAYS